MNITYTHKDGRVETHPTNNVDLSDFDSILNKIKRDDIRTYTRAWLHAAPEYIFDVAASSSGKYHPAIDLGTGGLKRHLINVAQMVIWLTEPECVRERFVDDEIDIMIAAALLHDCLKSGWQEDYEKSKYTRFDHPRLMATMLRCENTMAEKLPQHIVDMIADCVETHMGEWINDKYGNSEPLKKPTTEMQKIVHLADYLASRRDLSIVRNDTVYILDTQTVASVH